MPASRPGVGHVDPRDPFVLPVHELARAPGAMRRLRASVPAPAGMALPLVGIPAGSPVGLDLRLEAVMEGILVSGTATVATRAECGRCLTGFDATQRAAVQELYIYPDQVPAEDLADDPDGLLLVVDDHVDLGQVVRDAVLTALPLTPLCRPDCPGLCPRCGERLADLPPGHRHDDTDSRWAVLAPLAADPAPDDEET